MKNKFRYKWYLKDGYPAPGIEKHNKTVFSCFACGGGSTMGYKLAGYNVLGCNEIDPKMIEVYKKNHNPKYAYLEGIQTFKNREDLPEELYNLDILDGSPPCSSFSMSGNRSKDWGKEKKFREGQAKQTLDTLFFDFIDLAAKLRPKIVIAENVKGLLQGEAQKYVNEINKAFKKAGYLVQHWLFNASTMGVPQKRERVFFIAMREDLAAPFLYQANLFEKLPKIKLNFNFEKIIFFEVEELNGKRKKLTPAIQKVYDKRLPKDICLGETTQRIGKRKFFNYMINDPLKVSYTITAQADNLIYNNGYLTKKELIKIGTFPIDYNFLKNRPKYLIGMSVPPVMVAQIANQIYKQWLKFL